MILLLLTNTTSAYWAATINIQIKKTILQKVYYMVQYAEFTKVFVTFKMSLFQAATTNYSFHCNHFHKTHTQLWYVEISYTRYHPNQSRNMESTCENSSTSLKASIPNFMKTGTGSVTSYTSF